MLINIIQRIDQVFTMLIFIPIIVMLVKKFNLYKKWGKQALLLYRISTILVMIFLVRCFCQHFIFTPVNYQRFTDSGLFPLIKVLFYH